MRYNPKTQRVEISVGELCSRKAGRGGSAVFSEADSKRLFELTGGAPRDILLDISCGGIDFRITGRAEAVSEVGGTIRLSWLYVGRENPSRLPDDRLLCLAYMLSRGGASNVFGLPVEIEALILNPDTGELNRVVKQKTAAELKAVFMRHLTKKLGEAKVLAERARLVLPGAAAVKFPYPRLRQGQETMMRACYSALCGGRRLFVQAPTGIGKTISALYPAVKFLGHGHCDKIFYLTAKTSTQAEAYKTAGQLFSSGARLRTLILTAKENCCLCRGIRAPDMPCIPGVCPYADVPGDKISAAVSRLLQLQSGFGPKVIIATAKEFGVCPYELSLELSEHCEIIVADYNYAFDPLVRLRRYFEDQTGAGKYIFLIDEAHNLADRTREMYSAELCSSDFAGLPGMASCEVSELHKALSEAAARLRGLRRLCREDLTYDEAGIEHGFYIAHELPKGLDTPFRALCREIEIRLFRAGADPTAAGLAPLYRKLLRFLTVMDCFDKRFLFFCRVEGKKTFVSIMCLDPSEILARQLDRIQAAVFFSATLTPLEYFSDILGGGEKSETLALASPFDISNLFVAAVDNISTRYEDREKSLPAIVSYIAAVLSGKKGNYIAYFPSYEYMERAAAAFSAKYPRVEVLIQKKGMSREEKETFLDAFRAEDSKMRVGFCVLGGSFSEGIDLPGSRLIGVIIVGVGMPGISNERNIMRDYYEQNQRSGFDYAYTYPGMNNVLQAAGRVIRSDTDLGIVLLIDDRYATPKYAAMFPEHWRHMRHFTSPLALRAAVIDFWKG
ncbi:MAG: ATP-dependent DNA helicase [Eubacteriales bacterium]|jgi:Rad3-related DNA helicase